jgi:iron(III) transport system permease protein
MVAGTVKRRPSAGLLTACGVASGLVLLPLGVTAWNAASAGWDVATALLFRPLVGELLLNTLRLIGCATAGAALLGTAAAWFIERTDVPGRRIWAVLIVVPLAIPPFITSYAWVSLNPGLADFTGALLVVTVSYYPLVYLPVAAALREMDPALEETARTLGLRGWSIFARVILPQLRPALLGGMVLVALDVLVEFGAFALLRFRTFTTAIYSAYRAGFSGAEPALLAMILVLLCVVCLAAEFFVRGGARYGRLARGARRRATQYRLGAWRFAVQGGFAVWAGLSIGVPLGMILYWLAQPGSAATAPVTASAAAVAGAAWCSVYLGGAGAALTMALALPLGVLAARYDGWLVTLLERAAYLAQSVPGIVVALALVSLTVHGLRALYQSTALLVVAYAILFLPLALVSVRAALMQAQPGLEEAGRSLGLSPAAVLLRVSLPLAAPGLGAAAAMVFIAITTELTATLLLAPIGTRTLATQVWADTSTLAFAAAAPYAAVMAMMSMAASWLLASRFGAASVMAQARTA